MRVFISLLCGCGLYQYSICILKIDNIYNIDNKIDNKDNKIDNLDTIDNIDTLDNIDNLCFKMILYNLYVKIANISNFYEKFDNIDNKSGYLDNMDKIDSLYFKIDNIDNIDIYKFLDMNALFVVYTGIPITIEVCIDDNFIKPITEYH